MADENQRGLTRRGALGAAGAGALAATLPGHAEARAVKHRRRRTRRADVVVLGGGLAGLSAALALVKAGRSVIVLEARDRVGGRTLNERLADGTLIEHGGQFLFSPEREREIVALAREFGRQIIPQNLIGDNVYHRNGSAQRYPRHGVSGRIPPFDPLALSELLVFATTIDDMAAQVDPTQPWTAAKAGEWDAQTFDSFVRANTKHEETRFLLDVFARSLTGTEPRDLSLLYVLKLLAGTGGMTVQEVGEATARARFLHGVQSLPIAMAARLGSRVKLSTPVRRISQDGGSVRVQADRFAVTAKRAIVAFAPTLTGQLRYDPPLPAARAQLVQRFPQGTAIKVHCVYDKPFWRDDGLTGESFGDLEPIRVTEDVTLPYGAALLEGFITASSARHWMTRSRNERRQAVIANFTQILGPRAASPHRYVERIWADDVWTRGCFYGVLPPGVLIDYGEAIRRPVGRIHWAGTETAPEWAASIEGAVRSGNAAARDVLAGL
ncbi:MAG TPA: FAD-dependent oxidoreductase [Thermoleophilaceae bacterium]|jgi:monoamine oxidase